MPGELEPENAEHATRPAKASLRLATTTRTIRSGKKEEVRVDLCRHGAKFYASVRSWMASYLSEDFQPQAGRGINLGVADLPAIIEGLAAAYELAMTHADTPEVLGLVDAAPPFPPRPAPPRRRAISPAVQDRMERRLAAQAEVERDELERRAAIIRAVQERIAARGTSEPRTPKARDAVEPEPEENFRPEADEDG